MEIVWLLCILIGAGFGARAGCLGFIAGGLLGLFLGPIGVIIAIVFLRGPKNIEQKQTVVVVNQIGDRDGQDNRSA